ncbi:MAG: hypothetical protein RRZ24_11600 [Clostridia bacterium]
MRFSAEQKRTVVVRYLSGVSVSSLCAATGDQEVHYTHGLSKRTRF